MARAAATRGRGALSPPATPAATRRLSADARRAQIVTTAAAVVVERGVSGCTLEAVAAAAGISKALIYRHFSSRDDLLLAVAEHEFAALRGRGPAAFPPDLPFPRLLQQGYRHTFDYLYERGPVLRALLSEARVAERLKGKDPDNRLFNTKWFVDRAVRAYGVPRELALILTIIGINAPASSVRALRRYGIDSHDAADTWTEFMLAGWAAMAARHGSVAAAPASPGPVAKAATKAAAKAAAKSTARRARTRG